MDNNIIKKERYEKGASFNIMPNEKSADIVFYSLRNDNGDFSEKDTIHLIKEFTIKE